MLACVGNSPLQDSPLQAVSCNFRTGVFQLSNCYQLQPTATPSKLLVKLYPIRVYNTAQPGVSLFHSTAIVTPQESHLLECKLTFAMPSALRPQTQQSCVAGLHMENQKAETTLSVSTRSCRRIDTVPPIFTGVPGCISDVLLWLQGICEQQQASLSAAWPQQASKLWVPPAQGAWAEE